MVVCKSNLTPYPLLVKEVCNRAVTYQPALAKKSGEPILAIWLKTEVDSVNKILCLTSDVTMVRQKCFFQII